jgi:hypothetical protein
MQEVLGRERVAWFLRMLEDVEGFSNWRIQRVVRAAFGIDLSPWTVKCWRDAALRPVPTLLPGLQRYKEKPLILIQKQSTQEERESA